VVYVAAALLLVTGYACIFEAISERDWPRDTFKFFRC
jgi:hypothetical protein